MPSQTLRLQKGDSVSLPVEEGGSRLFRIERRTREGYVLSLLFRSPNRPERNTPSSEKPKPDELWTHEKIFDAYIDGTLQHWPCDLSGLDRSISDMLQTDLESWSERKIFEAQCREKYVLRAHKLRLRGVRAKDAYERSAKVVSRAYAKDWMKEADRITTREEEAALLVRRKPVPTNAPPTAMADAFKLSKSSVRNWYQVWIDSEFDVRALISKSHMRGWHGPRKESLVHKQQNDNEPLCVYGAMEKIGRTVWMQELKVTKKHAYKRFKEECARIGVKPLSDTTFNHFLWKRFTDFEEYRIKNGPRLAYLKFRIFQRRELPNRALEEVEVDHCLLDIWVKDKNGKKARPWLTVLICRATKMIIGFHLSFEVPSYTTLSRAIIHAMSPKDLSNIPEIKNDWPCHGVFDCLITDRGLEFLSESLARAGQDLRFAIVNLPGYMPHLKGTVERYFATLGIKVLSHLEGSTKSRVEQYHDPKAKARFTLEELSTLLVKWIVDDYHQAEHDTLGMAPAKKWKELVVDSLDGGVRPVPNFSRLVMLMGERTKRKISNVGIHFDNNLYASYELGRLRERRHGRTDWYQILADPTDRGHVWVLDKQDQRWLIVPAVNQRTSRGLNKFAMKVVMRMARKIAGKGNKVTDEIMVQARERCDRHAADDNSRRGLRYTSDGAIASQVSGNHSNILSVLAGAVMPTVPDDMDDQLEMFGDVPTLPPRQDGADWAQLPEPAAQAPAPTRKAKSKPKSQIVKSKKSSSTAEPDASRPQAGPAEVPGGPADEPKSKGSSGLKSLIARKAASRKVLV